ncbi:ATP-dependent helicase/nuclease subunit A [Anatilimnocola aggregata]|uniref:DNA 3'-5' helicase n=1 Tax=Anatilimnocola aggregata TaxID=2528021 RepID=A0A517YIE9_9BACT|nr:UvrD-helicase domain-containing protein [Anatilimnocola aggregata]QDU29985.1 ATP-dependent helicase/nuclease subunit A [Anatilimnocola aggregata]
MSTAFPHLLIRASAGTGKTYQLSNRYLQLLAAGVAPDKVLATTFTRKAAGEIFDRVLHRLAEAAVDRSASKSLSKALQLPELTQARCRELLIATLANQHRLRIGTLDSHFAQLATTFALELGLPAGWRIGEVQEDSDLQAEAIERVLERENLEELLALLHLLTKGETQRGVSDLIAGTVSDLYSLYSQTTEEAWNRLSSKPGLTAEQLEATLSELQKISPPADKRAVAAWQKDILNAETGDWESFIATGLAGKIASGAEKYYAWVFPDEVLRPYQALIDHAQSVLLKRLSQQTAATFKLLKRFDTEYRHLKQERRLLRFDDVTLALAAADQGTTADMSFRLGGRLNHLLLDEFQDTSLTQWQVLRPLAQAITKQQAEASLFCVGDVKQAIYGWRGGLAEIFGALEQELVGIENAKLVESRRSAQPIIDVVNQVFQNLTKHPSLDRYEAGVTAWERAFPPHTTVHREMPGHVTLETSPAAIDDDDTQDHHSPFVAQRIADLAKQAPGCSIGVLVRSNAMVAQLIYLLRKLDMPASEEGGNPLSDSPAVSLVLSLLRLIDHPGDTACQFHVATSPLAPNLNITRKSFPADIARLSQKLRRELLDEGYGAVVYRWAKWLAPHCDRRDLSRLQQLVELAFGYQPRSSLRTADFVNLVAAEKVADPQAAQIRVMTIHQSKGLQFDIVVLPELEGTIAGQPDPFVTGRAGLAQPVNVVCRYANEQLRNLMPNDFQKLFDANLRQKIDESLCVLYVALTRPVHALHMIIEPAKLTEKKPPKTAAGLLRAALALDSPASSGKLLYQHGQANWRQLQKSKSPTGLLDGLLPAMPASPPAPIQLAAKSKLAPHLDRVAPSQLEGGSRLKLAELFRPSSLGMRYGSLFHAWFEQVEWLDDGLPSEALLRKIAQQKLDLGATFNLTEAVERFYAVLKKPSLQQSLSRDAYRRSLIVEQPQRQTELASCEFKVLRERTFALRDGERLLNGAIDRLVVQWQGKRRIGAQVIDYKTDDVSPQGSLAKKTELYRPQMAAYCAAVAKLYDLPLNVVSARLIFLNSDEAIVISSTSP